MGALLHPGSSYINTEVPGLTFNTGGSEITSNVSPISTTGKTTLGESFSKIGGKALAGLAAIKGTIGSIQAADAGGRSPMGVGDLIGSAGMDTEYRNGVAVNVYTGFDNAGAAKMLRDYNNANTLNSISSGAEAGGGIGSLIAPGIGTAIGTVLGGIGGWVTGLINRGKAKRKMHE